MSFVCKNTNLRGDNVDRTIRMLWKRDNFRSLEANHSNEVEDTRRVGDREM